MAKFSTEALRTVALVGHGASGKTTLAEALLHKAGMIQATGTVERGSTVCDFDPLEKQFQHSLRSAIVHLDHAGTRTHLIDTPGSPDFIGQAIGHYGPDQGAGFITATIGALLVLFIWNRLVASRVISDPGNR